MRIPSKKQTQVWKKKKRKNVTDELEDCLKGFLYIITEMPFCLAKSKSSGFDSSDQMLLVWHMPFLVFVLERHSNSVVIVRWEQGIDKRLKHTPKKKKKVLKKEY